MMEGQHNQRRSIYIVGAQCTGKTTLAEALESRIKNQPVHRISEVARNVLREHDFNRDHITNSPNSALRLQELILKAQYDAEMRQKDHLGVLICDRSGIDPIVYAAKYGPPGSVDTLLETEEWKTLEGRMKDGLVVLCPPQKEWLHDDGTRLMASDWAEWMDVHDIFEKLLEQRGIRFIAVPTELLDLDDRVSFVLQH